jgi:hypothetical protein
MDQSAPVLKRFIRRWLQLRLDAIHDTAAANSSCGKLVTAIKYGKLQTWRCYGDISDGSCYNCDQTGFSCHCGNTLKNAGSSAFCSNSCHGMYYNY